MCGLVPACFDGFCPHGCTYVCINFALLHALKPTDQSGMSEPATSEGGVVEDEEEKQLAMVSREGRGCAIGKDTMFRNYMGCVCVAVIFV